MKSSLIDINFFEKVVSEYVNAKNSLTEFNESNFISIYNFCNNFFNFNNVYLFNISKVEFESLISDKNHDLFFLFLKRYIVEKVNSGVCNIHFVNLNNIKPKYNTLSSSNSKLNDRYFVFNEDDLIFDFKTLQEKKVFQIDKNMKNTFPGGWNFLNDFNITTNSIIIFDRYLSLSENHLVFNLYRILGNLKINKNIPLQITILKCITKSNKIHDVNKQIYELNNSYSLITNFLKNELKLNSFEIEIAYHNANVNYIRNSSIPHSREILSNYFRLVSDHSFNYFDVNGNLDVSCKLDFIPILSDNYSHYLTKLSEIKIYKNRDEIEYVNNLKINNRLFDLV